MSNPPPAPTAPRRVEDERAAFEKWARDDGSIRPASDHRTCVDRSWVNDDGSVSYADASIDTAWLAWQARAALALAPSPATGDGRDALRDLLRYVETIGCDETNPAVVAARSSLEGRAPDPARGEVADRAQDLLALMGYSHGNKCENPDAWWTTDNPHARYSAVVALLDALKHLAPARGPAGDTSEASREREAAELVYDIVEEIANDARHTKGERAGARMVGAVLRSRLAAPSPPHEGGAGERHCAKCGRSEQVELLWTLGYGLCICHDCKHEPSALWRHPIEGDAMYPVGQEPRGDGWARVDATPPATAQGAGEEVP